MDDGLGGHISGDLETIERKLCPKCESNHWMQNLPLVCTDGSALHVYSHPSWAGMSMRTGMKASVCGDCGYTELYAEKHADLLEEWQKQNA